MSIDGVQDKQKEIAFFDRHAEEDDYDVFTPQASARLIEAVAPVLQSEPRMFARG